MDMTGEGDDDPKQGNRQLLSKKENKAGRLVNPIKIQDND